jgi:TPR repeat protein
MYEKGNNGLSQDNGKAASLYRRGCDSGYMGGCFELGVLYHDGRGVQQDDAQALRLFEQGCKAHYAVACNELGIMHAHGRGGLIVDSAAAAKLYEKACKWRDPSGCFNRATQFEDGVSGPKDDRRAADWFQRGCKLGGVQACTSFGRVLLKTGQPKDAAHAARIFRDACDAGDMRACYAGGMLFKDGHGVPRDQSLGRVLLQRACNGGLQESCEQLAGMR